MVFTITDDAISPRKGQFEEALKRLSGAHVRAQQVGVAHLHRQVVAAADQAGVPSDPVGVFWRKGEAYVGIAHGEAGDRLADIEYGTPDDAPSPVLRTAHRDALPHAKGLYAHTLIRESGL